MGYTFQSGMKTVTVSTYCPICRRRRTWDTEPTHVSLSQLCCSDTCADSYKQRLIGFENSVRSQHQLSLYRQNDSDECYAVDDGTLSWLGVLTIEGNNGPEMDEVVHKYRKHFDIIDMFTSMRKR